MMERTFKYECEATLCLVCLPTQCLSVDVSKAKRFQKSHLNEAPIRRLVVSIVNELTLEDFKTSE
mgnify:CR=1 FL=1